MCSFVMTMGFSPGLRPSSWAKLTRTSAFLGMCEEGDIDSKFITATDESVPQGYLNPDVARIADGQKTRVFIYIGLALVPCLFLVPFFLSREFVPPVELIDQ